ncbi:hypothetical protein HPB48_017947 [Haemaphysalis longicornis]|uniref:Uncharacterized protein n=1 Tax=Haemaphysalis longicornis TaxID=44386 RepID=A0A9J6GK47_HAELO|nr:hypothetical protein HPB48_017947 [Haemaphysalis longicornis]
MLSLAPKLQPGRGSFFLFKAFKAAYNNAAREWMVSHQGDQLTTDPIRGLVRKASNRSGNIRNIAVAFEKSDVGPFLRTFDPEFDDPSCARGDEDLDNVVEKSYGIDSSSYTEKIEEVTAAGVSFVYFSPTRKFKKVRRKSESTTVLASSSHKTRLTGLKAMKRQCSCSSQRKREAIKMRGNVSRLHSMNKPMMCYRSPKNNNSTTKERRCLICKTFLSSPALGSDELRAYKLGKVLFLKSSAPPKQASDSRSKIV